MMLLLLWWMGGLVLDRLTSMVGSAAPSFLSGPLRNVLTHEGKNKPGLSS